MNNLHTHYFTLFACCIAVKGARRSLICDIQRGGMDFIPNDLYDLLQNECKQLTYSEILAQFEAEDRETVQEYFDFLIAKEYGFWCESLEEMALFPPIEMVWDAPAHITNAIIDVAAHSQHDFANIFEQLENLGCKDIQIRFFCEKELSFLAEIGEILENRRIKSCDIIWKYKADLPLVCEDTDKGGGSSVVAAEDTDNGSEYISLLQKYYRFSHITVHSAPFEKRISADLDATTAVVFTQQKITDATHCGVIHPAYFVLNIETFTEAHLHNTCLNRKLSIDANGDICNCPTLPQRFGNVVDTPLATATKQADFQTKWHIHKDQIEVCKDCEFRYICTDCRAFVAGEFDKPAKCGYNPYIAKWA